MPELPEVEVTRLGLLPHLPGRTICDIKWSDKRLRSPIPHELLQTAIRGQTVRTLERRAKYLLLRMDSGSVMIIHLGMTGKLGIFSQTAPTARHDHLILCLDDGREMRFNDCRRFGEIKVWPAAEANSLEREFNNNKGIEPLGNGFTISNIQKQCQGRRQPIKTFLMDGRRIAGIGNIYANEILFGAGIHPETPVNRISSSQWQDIIEQSRRILKKAIAAGGSTISDFIGSSGQPGYFQLQLAVYGKKDHPCPRCKTPIVKGTIGGRATFYCPSCQPDYEE